MVRVSGARLAGGRRLSLSTKIYLFATLVTLSSVLSAGALMYQAQKRESERMLAILLLNIARTAAPSLPGEVHDSLRSPAQAATTEYQHMRTLLDRVRVENGLSTASLRTGRLLDASAVELVVTLDGTPIGRRETPAPEVMGPLRRLYDSGRAQTTALRQVEGAWSVSALAPIRDGLGRVVGFLEVDSANSGLVSTTRQRIVPILEGLAIGAALALSVAFFLSFGITRPIWTLQQLMQGIARGGGDLTLRVPVDSRDAIGMLAAAINEFVSLIETLVRQVLRSANAVGAFTKRVVSISQEQVQAAAEQAAAVQQTTRTIGELVRTFQETADRSKIVSQEAQEAMTVAEDGVARLRETVQEMERVKSTSVETIQEIYGLVERSHEIGQVMHLINDVAAKTKLIAFNAAIEASSAGGEAGRRFSVVAQEVRRLAERVVKSTGEIESIIKDIQSRVEKLILKTEENYRKIERGFASAEEAKRALQEIVQGVARTAEAAFDIGNTTRTQTVAGEQIIAALHEIDATTRAFKRSVAGMKSTAIELDGLFVELLSHTGKFRVSDTPTD